VLRRAADMMSVGGRRWDSQWDAARLGEPLRAGRGMMSKTVARRWTPWLGWAWSRSAVVFQTEYKRD